MFNTHPIIISKDRVNEPLYAVVPFFNPWRWKHTVKNLQRALKHFHDSGVVIILVEAGFNRRELVFKDFGLDGMMAECGVTDDKFRHKYIGLHTKDELWLKENLVNIGFQHAPWDWQNGCMLDGDVHFVRPNWVGECIHKLQHGGTSDSTFVQMFSHARDVGPDYEILPETYPHASGRGFVSAWKEGLIKSSVNPVIAADIAVIEQDLKKLAADVAKLKHDLGEYYGYPGYPRVFPGLAWAHTRKAFDAVGGMLDIAVWGGGDWHMSHALIGKREGMMLDTLHPHYKQVVHQWADRCDRHIRRNVLCMDGTILHAWHGKKTGRGYNSKHTLLAEIQFDPTAHLKRDSSGLWQLHDDGSESFTKLRDGMRSIAADRNEDSIDI